MLQAQLRSLYGPAYEKRCAEVMMRKRWGTKENGRMTCIGSQPHRITYMTPHLQ